MQQDKPTPSAVFRKRQAGTARTQVTPEEQEMHKVSSAQYPELSLSPGEYVLSVVRRHPIGLIAIWSITGILVFVTLALVPFYATSMGFISTVLAVPIHNLPTPITMTVPALILTAFFLLGGFIATYVYQQNRFYITTESIVQFVQYSLFNSKQQVVNLINVEDVSADQTGIVQQVLNYGTLRLSTQGQETIYHFRFVAKPNDVVHHINDATEIAIQRLEGTGFPPTELAS
jgi:energy-coupling factor transporter transmembrane protein EcfT